MPLPIILGGLAASGATVAATLAIEYGKNCPLTNPAPPTVSYKDNSDSRVRDAYFNNQFQFKDQGSNVNWKGEIKNTSVPGFADTSGRSRL